ncbi:MAG: methyltransferase domain-containing protein [Pseudomonadota bacterium]
MTDLPLEFDAEYYRDRHADTRHLSIAEAWAHYDTTGRSEGRWGSHWAGRNTFVELVPKGEILEIGPGSRPVFAGANVSYFDALTTDQLKARARTFGEAESSVPELTYSDPNGDLSSINKTFDAVFSSHLIEHQPDLVSHLNQVERLLRPGGKYYLLCPDMRFTCDAGMAPSTIGDVLQAYVEKRNRHTLANKINASVMHQSNDGKTHWDGLGRERYHYCAELLLDQIKCHEHDTEYVDVHAWFFTPSRFRSCLTALNEMGLSRLRPLRVYETPRPANEFCAILG